MIFSWNSSNKFDKFSQSQLTNIVQKINDDSVSENEESIIGEVDKLSDDQQGGSGGPTPPTKEKAWEERLKGVEDKTKKVEAKQSEIEIKVRAQYSESKSLMSRMISIFGVFTSVSTLVLVEIQLFTVVCSPFQLMGLSMVFAAILLTFLYLLLIFFHGDPAVDTPVKIDIKSWSKEFFPDRLTNSISVFFEHIKPSTVLRIIIWMYIVGIILVSLGRFLGGYGCESESVNNLRDRVSKIEGAINP